MKKKLILLGCLPFLMGTAFAQGPNAPVPETQGTVPTPPPDMPPPPPPSSDIEVPDELLDLHTQVTELRDALRESRNAVLKALGEEASRDETVAALTSWREDNADAIAQMRELSAELRDAIREERPRPGGGNPVIPDEISEMRDTLRNQRIALAESREAVIEALGDEATDDQIRAAIEQWREDNADAIAETRALAAEIRNWFRQNRPDRGGNNGGPPADVRERRQQFKENASQIRQNRRQFANAMANPDLSPEERAALREEFRSEQQELIEERKQLRRQERIDQVGPGGDRRPGG